MPCLRDRADFRPYQHQAERFILATPRCYLAAKAGAGKTGIALAVIESLMFDRFEVRRVLLVGPKRVVPQWPEEARKWAFGQHLRFSLYLGSSEQRKTALSAEHDVLGCTFEFFPELVKAIPAKRWNYDLVVFDEASRLRQGGRQGSVGWKAMNAICSKTGSRVLLMSGSPRPGTAHELFAPVFLLDQGERLGKTLTGFRTAYLEPNKANRHTGQVYSWKLRAGMEQALYDRIRDLYFAVAPDLGLPSVVIDRLVRLPERVEAACRELRQHQVLDLDQLELTAGSQATVEGKLHQMCQGCVFSDMGIPISVHDEKLDELAQVIDEVDGPLLVAYWYTHDRDRLMQRFPDAVDISTPEGLAAAKAGRVRLGLLHPGSAAHGIDGLQAHFSAIAWFAIPASFELYDQANKRIVRSGQRETVRIYRIIAENGLVDPKAIERLAQKAAEQDAFFKHLEERSPA